MFVQMCELARDRDYSRNWMPRMHLGIDMNDRMIGHVHAIVHSSLQYAYISLPGDVEYTISYTI